MLGRVSPGGMRFAALIRAAPSMHVDMLPSFKCPLCAAPCTGWGVHILKACPLAAGAVLRAFRSTALALLRRGWSLLWRTTTCFEAGLAGKTALAWHLVNDFEVSNSATSCQWDVAVTWSGLVWCRQVGTVTLSTRQDLTVGFLWQADEWLGADAGWRWETLANPTDPALDPLRVIGSVPILCSTQVPLGCRHSLKEVRVWENGFWEKFFFF